MPDNEKKPKYHTPIVVDLNELARGLGACTTGSGDIDTCTVGPSALTACTEGAAAQDGCTAGGAKSPF